MHKARLAYLLSIYFDKTATAAEVDELMEAVADSRHDKELKSLLTELWEQHHGHHQPISEEKGNETLIAILQKGRALKPVAGKKRWWPAAAAAVLVLIIGSSYWMNGQMFTHENIEEQPDTYVIKPGGNKAVLTLADGSHIELDSSREGTLTTQGNAVVVNNSSSILAYGANKSSRGEPVVYNTLSTPRGGQYCLILSDGTKVWLNANSSIRFPAAFNGDTRSVSINGEVYFEVAKNKAKPFLVTAKEATITVLGTHFNIMAYEDESMMTTTLLEGAVKVSKGDKFKLLKPGLQAQILGDGTMKTEIVDVDEEMAWKNGWFNFNSWDIQRIMRQISRWYDIDVVYEGRMPAGHYSGIVSRENNISQVLQIMKAGGVDFKIEDRRIIVSEGH